MRTAAAYCAGLLRANGQVQVSFIREGIPVQLRAISSFGSHCIRKLRRPTLFPNKMRIHSPDVIRFLAMGLHEHQILLKDIAPTIAWGAHTMS